MSVSMGAAMTPRQIRAARALLDWSQDDLANVSKVSVATIRKIETGVITPRDRTVQLITEALSYAGIVFSGTSGVRLRENDIQTLEGSGCFLQLLDMMYHALRDHAGEALYMNADHARTSEEEKTSLLRMRKEGIRFRYLIEEGNTHILWPLHEVRWIPKKYFRSTLQIIFGNRVAHCLYTNARLEEVAKIMIVDNACHAEAMRNAFQFMWDKCAPATKTTARPIPLLFDQREHF